MIKFYGQILTLIKKLNNANLKGYSQVLWTDTSSDYVEEVGTMSIMFRIKNKLVTPKISETILDGVTRKSVIQISKDLGIQIEERDITVSEIISEYVEGNLKEIFGCGTAAVIATITSFGYKDKTYKLNDINEKYGDKIKAAIVSIQQNLSEDNHGWRYKIDK